MDGCIVCGDRDPMHRNGRCMNVPGSVHVWRDATHFSDPAPVPALDLSDDDIIAIIKRDDRITEAQYDVCMAFIERTVRDGDTPPDTAVYVTPRLRARVNMPTRFP